jgi:peptidoglycan hydrolase FlgJ
MNPSIADAGTSGAIYTDLRGLAALRVQAQASPDDALVEAAQQFESLFIQMMLTSMRAAKLGDGILDSDAGTFYQDLYDKQMSLSIGGHTSANEHSGLGIADMLVRQLRASGAVSEGTEGQPAGPASAGLPARVVTDTLARTGGVAAPVRRAARAASEFAAVAALGRSAHELAPQAARPAELVPEVADGVAQRAVQTSAPAVQAERFDSPREFVRQLWVEAERAASALGVQPQTLLAQAALESGWGKHTARHGDGRNSHNLFGIKAHQGWDGERVTVATTEYENGTRVRREDAFRAYQTYADSFADYVNLLTDNPRYRAALSETADPQRFFSALQRAGYATDPAYASKLMSVLSGSAMREALVEFK